MFPDLRYPRAELKSNSSLIVWLKRDLTYAVLQQNQRSLNTQREQLTEDTQPSPFVFGCVSSEWMQKLATHQFYGHVESWIGKMKYSPSFAQKEASFVPRIPWYPTVITHWRPTRHPGGPTLIQGLCNASGWVLPHRAQLHNELLHASPTRWTEHLTAAIPELKDMKNGMWASKL